MCIRDRIIYAWYTRSISIGSVVALLTLVDNAYTPIAIFNVLFVQFRLDSSAFGRYADFLDLPEESRLFEGKKLTEFQGDISIRKAVFSYHDMPVLKAVSLSISPGEKVALAGNSGSGKSTLIKLIAGLLKTEEGSISIDGNDLNRLNPVSYTHLLAHFKEIGFFLGGLYFPAAVRAFAVHQLGLRPEGFTGSTVKSFIMSLVNISLIIQALKNLLYLLYMIIIRGTDKFIIGCSHQIPEALYLTGYLVHIFLRGYPCLLGF